MFAQLKPANRRRLQLALAVSLTVHGVVIGVLARRPTPRFVSPPILTKQLKPGSRFVSHSFLMAGSGGHAYETIYLYGTGQSEEDSLLKRAAPAKPAPKPATAQKQLTLPTPEPAQKQEVAAATPAARVGSPLGTSLYGSPTGHDVRPALPVVGPHPSVSRSELPPGVQGDVVVEITIDALGNIIGTKFVKTLGYGVDEKVLATLQQWHFTPATQDGIAIPSQQYVYFHFPG